MLPNAEVYLYGSYSRGTQRTESDIDIAVVVPHITDHYYDDRVRLWRLTMDINIIIEPILMAHDEGYSPLYEEVMENGLLIA